MGDESALIAPIVTELKIPTTKLNFMQEKKYREWGFKTLEEIEKAALEIEQEEKGVRRYIQEQEGKKVFDYDIYECPKELKGQLKSGGFFR